MASNVSRVHERRRKDQGQTSIANALARDRAQMIFSRARTVRHSSPRRESDVRSAAARDSLLRVAAVVRQSPQRGPLWFLWATPTLRSCGSYVGWQTDQV